MVLAQQQESVKMAPTKGDRPGAKVCLRTHVLCSENDDHLRRSENERQSTRLSARRRKSPSMGLPSRHRKVVDQLRNTLDHAELLEGRN
jgi:hypothetical protein